MKSKIDEVWEKLKNEEYQNGEIDISGSGNYFTIAKYEFEKAVEELMKEFKNQLIEEFMKKDIIENTEIQNRKPTHGPCCTCQTCGYVYDECRCRDNEIIETILNIEI